jgi:hypothetical protein
MPQDGLRQTLQDGGRERLSIETGSSLNLNI